MAIAVLGVIVAGGCSSTTEEEPPACPRVSVLGEAATMTQFADGRGRDLTDVAYEAEVSDVRSQCESVGGDDGRLVVALAPVIQVSRGPADEGGVARFEYFVSITDSARNILNVVRFPVSVGFPGNQSRVTVTDDDPPVTVDIPDSEGAENRAGYQVFVGLQLTPEQLEYNRRRHGAHR